MGTLKIHCIHTPCHTTGHFCFFVQSQQEKALFTGDTLFLGGCGRFFEGNAQDMYSSLQKLMSLPDETKVYPGHEYTLKNYMFARSVDANNSILNEKYKELIGLDHVQSVPGSIKFEKQTNPFIKLVYKDAEPVKKLAELRAMKDTFQ